MNFTTKNHGTYHIDDCNIADPSYIRMAKNYFFIFDGGIKTLSYDAIIRITNDKGKTIYAA